LCRISQEEMSIFWEIIRSKKLYKHMCPIPNGFRDRATFLYTTDEQHAVSSHDTLYRRATRYVLARVTKSIDVEGGIFENVLY
ncbi:hypothetical protein B7P43_G16990, partial [Cryptotermes secundus]